MIAVKGKLDIVYYRGIISLLQLESQLIYDSSIFFESVAEEMADRLGHSVCVCNVCWTSQ